MSINSNVSIKIFEENLLNYKIISLEGQESSVSSIFLDPIIRHTNIHFDISHILTDDEIRLLNIREDNEYTICSDMIRASIMLDMMEKIYNKLLLFKGNASEVLEMDIKTIDLLPIDEADKKERKVEEIKSYMLFADTFGKLTGILTVAKAMGLNVQIEITYG
jgi:hypothetical protein